MGDIASSAPSALAAFRNCGVAGSIRNMWSPGDGADTGLPNGLNGDAHRGEATALPQPDGRTSRVWSGRTERSVWQEAAPSRGKMRRQKDVTKM